MTMVAHFATQMSTLHCFYMLDGCFLEFLLMNTAIIFYIQVYATKASKQNVTSYNLCIKSILTMKFTKIKKVITPYGRHNLF